VGTLLNGQHSRGSGRPSLLHHQTREFSDLVIEFGAPLSEVASSGGECASSQNPGPPESTRVHRVETNCHQTATRISERGWTKVQKSWSGVGAEVGAEGLEPTACCL